LERLRKLEIATLHWDRIWSAGTANFGIHTVMHHVIVKWARPERLDERVVDVVDEIPPR